MCLQPRCRKRNLIFLPLFLTLGIGGCASAKSGPRPDGLEPGGSVFTRSEIQEMRVRTALEVVERGARHLLIQRTRQGTPVKIYHRGIESIYLDAEVHVVVDGLLVNYGVQALNDIPSSAVEFIQILSARDGTTKYGASAGAGIILVKTTAG